MDWPEFFISYFFSPAFAAHAISAILRSVSGVKISPVESVRNLANH